MKLLKKLLCAAVMTGAMASSAYAAKGTINMGTMSWEDLTPITYVTKNILEKAGYDVKVTEFSEIGIAYAALVKGDVQFMASQIDYAAQDYWSRNKSRLEKLSPVSFGLYQAVAVPKYVTIDSMKQLNENASKFGDKIVGIEPGSGLMRDAASAVKAYDLKLKLVDGSTAGMTAALKSAVDRKEWIAVTLWEPTWMMVKYDMKFLKDPKNVFPGPQAYYWIGKKGFAEANPEVREILAGIYLPLSAIADINVGMNDGQTVQQASKAWIAKNADLVKRWENIKKY
ncbi:glycine betaine ABC transporter substrate-binding protein [Castellaniella sp. MT123]|uniref:glycine betaine ABC transporter substrate-binding protein n=1 Tax=Castellaniella sp. MT123 TaxID=3140381 RepID=UPI0031F45606